METETATLQRISELWNALKVEVRKLPSRAEWVETINDVEQRIKTTGDDVLKRYSSRRSSPFAAVPQDRPPDVISVSESPAASHVANLLVEQTSWFNGVGPRVRPAPAQSQERRSSSDMFESQPATVPAVPTFLGVPMMRTDADLLFAPAAPHTAVPSVHTVPPVHTAIAAVRVSERRASPPAPKPPGPQSRGDAATSTAVISCAAAALRKAAPSPRRPLKIARFPDAAVTHEALSRWEGPSRAVGQPEPVPSVHAAANAWPVSNEPVRLLEVTSEVAAVPERPCSGALSHGSVVEVLSVSADDTPQVALRHPPPAPRSLGSVSAESLRLLSARSGTGSLGSLKENELDRLMSKPQPRPKPKVRPTEPTRPY
eukprot:Gregarina_sp_Pseudo_9__1645@NODE_2106_length_1148_cov_7_363390_g1944_i0_p2_GENE_NODE_2106_length_1148_cov_7_363390_g1944_i0NODE_2106_length_1148_cov_7_363390_g1944_i0_p2_ORF_typecomplete_len372_score83_92_NODE_2106_length_1148_cov_7_363390_g1944_i0171132